MVILSDKGGGTFPGNLLIKSAAHGTTGTWNVLPLHQIKTSERNMKRNSMVSSINTLGEDDRYMLNLDSLSGIYMNTVKEAQFRIVAENRRKKYEV